MADTDYVLNLAAIIREVDGTHDKGAATLAESILDHPNFRDILARWGNPAPTPVPVSERLPGPEDCDAEGRCWWLALHQSWPCLYLLKADIALAAAVATHWLPAHALPLPEVDE